MRRASLLCLLVALLTACERDDAAFDVQGSLWQVSCTRFQGKFQACYGPGWSEDTLRYKEKYDFYEISVERINENSSTVLVSKRFSAAEVKKSVLDRHARDIVRIDEKNMKVSFQIKDDPYVVDLSNYTRSN